MCAICDGMTPEELLSDTHERIERFGFTVAGVEPDPDHPGWLYTIGLVRHGHPEVAVLGVPIENGQRLLQGIGEEIVGGEHYVVGETVDVGEPDFHFHLDEIDPRLWEGDMFNGWKEYFAWCGDDDVEPAAVELVRCNKPLRRRRPPP